MSGEDALTHRMDATAGAGGGLGAYRLVVVEGPDASASVVVDTDSPSRVLVGQSSACHLQLHDRLVSRRHVAFDLHPRGLKITDLGSTNGTLVNGILVNDAVLRGGELVRLGNTTLRLDRDDDAALRPLSPSAGFGRMVGASVAMKRLYPLCERLSLSELPVVIEGETGVGKELLAEALHETGPRRSKPFVVFDCTAVPAEAVLRVLFGDGDVPGASAFEQAEGGTLLIDEVAELGDEAQARLLRVLDRGELRRAHGGAVRVDVRVLAATRRDLEQAVQDGRFREDLFYRLAASRIELPPLREREGDVALLAQTFWRRIAGPSRPLPADFLARFERHAWPGNVRELLNAVARRLALGAHDRFGEPEPAPPSAQDPMEEVLALGLPLADARARLVEEFERRYLAKVLDQHGGSVSRAAAASGIARRYFQILRARHAK